MVGIFLVRLTSQAQHSLGIRSKAVDESITIATVATNAHDWGFVPPPLLLELSFWNTPSGTLLPALFLPEHSFRNTPPPALPTEEPLRHMLPVTSFVVDGGRNGSAFFTMRTLELLSHT